MSKQLSEFARVDGFEGVYSAQTATHRCIAVRLKSGGVCLYSPVAGLSVVAQKSLEMIGEVTFLLAPFYHNKALQEYRQAYLHARLSCPPDRGRVRLGAE